MSSSCKPANLLLVLFLSGWCVQQVTTATCTNIKGDAYCQTRLSTADYCTLSNADRCDCAKDCKAPAECNEAFDHDQSCDCPFSAELCDETWMIQGCNYTCYLRSVVTCPTPTLAVSNASLRYNGAVPSYGLAKYMDEATYDCDPGYVNASGSSKPYRRVCARSGNWVLDPSHQRDIICQPVRCGAPPTIPLATPSLAIGYFDDHVTYRCDPARAVQLGGGTGERRCAENGTWVEEGLPAPVCLELAVKFVNSRDVMTGAPQDAMTSHFTRSRLECASHCANLVHCYGYTFDVHTKVCQLNTGQATPVITTMTRVFSL